MTYHLITYWLFSIRVQRDRMFGEEFCSAFLIIQAVGIVLKASLGRRLFQSCL